MVAVENDGKVTGRACSRWSFFRSPSEGEAVAIQSTEAVTAIVRITGKDFRLPRRLLAQVTHLMGTNDRRVAIRAVVEAPRERLVIGAV